MIHSFDNFVKHVYENYAANESAETFNSLVKKELGSTNFLEGTASLRFTGEKLEWLVNGAVTNSWNAVSGLSIYNSKPSEWGTLLKSKFQSNTEFSKIPDAGPTPPGKYLLGKLQTRPGNPEPVGYWTAVWAMANSSSVPDLDKNFNANTEMSKIGWGNHRIAMLPASGTNTFERTSMYIHGGSLPGSHGCIDLTTDMPSFAKQYSAWIAKTGGKSKMSLAVVYEGDKKSWWDELFSSLSPDKAMQATVALNPQSTMTTGESSNSSMA